MKKSIKIILALLIIVVVLFFAFVILQNNNKEKTKIENPASNFCIEEGGSVEIRSNDLGEYGVCIFNDNSECEEWMFFNGNCNIGDFIREPNKACTLEYNPVCGVNGVTYSNPCMAGEVPIVKEGSC